MDYAGEQISGDVLESGPTLEKSRSDHRDFRCFSTKGGMKMLVISDPGTIKAACALAVRVGSLSDPPGLEGCAHFVEHLLFCGTLKSPAESDFNEFLSARGGSSNAHTTDAVTNFHFDIAADYLDPALARFVEFFLSPAFEESAVSREISAVDSEFHNYESSDVWRFMEIRRTVSDTAHAYRRNVVGNEATLSGFAEIGSLPDELRKFFTENYCSNLMSVVVIGRESLDLLTDMALRHFCRITQKPAQPKVWPSPYSAKDLGFRIRFHSIENVNRVTLLFTTTDLDVHYKLGVATCIEHILGYQGPGSTFAELKRLGFAEGWTGSVDTPAPGFSFVSLEVDLTKSGLENVDEVVGLIFAYIKLAIEQGISKVAYSELANQTKRAFEFREPDEPIDEARNLAEDLHRYELPDVLRGGFMMPAELEKAAVASVLATMKPENMLLFIASKHIELEPPGLLEPFFNVTYEKSPFQGSVAAKWAEMSAGESVRLPDANEYSVSNLDVIPSTAGSPLENGKQTVPLLIVDDAQCEGWFLANGRLPKLCCYVNLSSLLCHRDELHAVMTQLFVAFMHDDLAELADLAASAGVLVKVTASQYSVTVRLEGFSQRIPEILVTILRRLQSLAVDDQRYALFKDSYERGLSDFDVLPALDQAHEYLTALLSDYEFSNAELRDCFDELTFEDFRRFVDELKLSFSVKCLTYGNLLPDHAVSLVRELCGLLPTEDNGFPDEQHADEAMSPGDSISKENVAPCEKEPGAGATTTEVADAGLIDAGHSDAEEDQDYAAIPPESEFIVGDEEKGGLDIFEVTNSTHRNSAALVCIQCGEEKPARAVMIRVLALMLSPMLFHNLRTLRELGYVVTCQADASRGTLDLLLGVQGDASPRHMDDQIENVLSEFEAKLEQMPADVFDLYKEALHVELMSSPTKYSAIASKLYSEIASQERKFTRDEDDISVLETITKNQLNDFFRETVSSKAPNRRKLSIRVTSSKVDKASEVVVEELLRQVEGNELVAADQANVFKAVREFKVGRTRFPRSCGTKPSVFSLSADIDR